MPITTNRPPARSTCQRRSLALALAIAGLGLVGTSAASAQSGPWRQYATPEQAGWSSEKLEEAHAYAEQIGSAAAMAVHRGKVVFAWGDVSRRFMCHSVRKSFLSALYGIAVAGGQIDLQATMAELEIAEREPLTAEENQARVVDLISARSGIYLPAAYSPQSMIANLPDRGSAAPGTSWYYNNWDFNTSGAIFNRLTERDLYEAFDEWIARPIGMEDFRVRDGVYVLEPSKSIYPAYTFRMSSRDMARFGQLFLQDGVWDGERLLPKGWVEESTAMHTDFGDGRGYGYMWWVDPAGGGPAGAEPPLIDRYDKYEARGTGGQAIMVIPELELVIVHRGDTDNDRQVGGGDRLRLFTRILEARTGEASADPELIDLDPIPMADVLPAPPERAEIPLDPARVGDYPGRYALAGGVLVATIFEYEGRLFISLPDQGEAEMFAESEDLFFLRAAPATTEFSRDEEGAVNGMTFSFGGESYQGDRLPPDGP